MPHARAIVLTSLALLAFAGNSLLCRVALAQTSLDPASFTAIRLVSGALTLWMVVVVRRGAPTGSGNWSSALALFVYAAAFSFAYVSLPTATGALLLFGAVQITMISHGLWAGERFRSWQAVGFILAFAGLVGLVAPGVSAPEPHGAMLMLGAGVAWGVYSVRGRRAGDPTRVTAGNFMRAAPLALVLVPWMVLHTPVDALGVACAIASGALASGIGYVVWYAAVPMLRSTTAATVQLLVPLLAAIGGIVFLAEPLTLRLVLATVAVLGGIALVVRPARRG